VKTHPLHYAHGRELIVSHNTIWDGFTSIVRYMMFHVSHEQTYVLPLPSFQNFHWQVDIVLFIDGTHTFIDVVIATPT
jgi:hypothetical protein